jgi:hypothetical protein
MKLTVKQIKKLIKEEIYNMLRESYSFVGTPEDVARQLMKKHQAAIRAEVLNHTLIELENIKYHGIEDQVQYIMGLYPVMFKDAAASAANMDEDPSYEIGKALAESEEGEEIIENCETLIAIKVLHFQGKLEEFLSVLDSREKENFMSLLDSKDGERLSQAVLLFDSFYEKQIQNILSSVGYKRNK